MTTVRMSSAQEAQKELNYGLSSKGGRRRKDEQVRLEHCQLQ